MDFTGQRVIVTGAGKGIGKATAELLAAKGATVIGISRTQADLDALAIKGIQTIRADLSDASACRAVMAEAGATDHLVNCAGTNVLEPVLEMSEAGYDIVMNINLRAALICAQEFARARIAAGGGGSIVNVTSIAGHRGFPEHMVYAASKAGLEGASRVLAKELGPHGIRVNCVAPTITLTELAAEAWSAPEKSQPMMVRHPLGRFAEVEQVAGAIAMLMGPGSEMVTGSVLPVDGGFLAV